MVAGLRLPHGYAKQSCMRVGGLGTRALRDGAAQVESLTAARQGAASEPSDTIRAVNALLTQLDQLRGQPNVMARRRRTHACFIMHNMQCSAGHAHVCPSANYARAVRKHSCAAKQTAVPLAWRQCDTGSQRSSGALPWESSSSIVTMPAAGHTACYLALRRRLYRPTQ